MTKTFREVLLTTEDGLILLAEDGRPFGVLIEFEEQNKQGGTRRPAWRPSLPLIPRIEIEEDEALLLCGAL